MNNPLHRVLSKISLRYWSLWFRIRNRIFTGKIRSDRESVLRSHWESNIVLRGSVSVSCGNITISSGCRIAKTAELGCEQDGTLILEADVSLGPRSILSTSGATVKIGAKTSFFSDCLVSGDVAIGEGCLFANNVTILTSTHEIYGSGTIRENDARARNKVGFTPFKAVTIGSDCWLGANSVVLPGVNLGKGCVVGANAVVTKSFPEYSILAGAPAIVIGSRHDKKL